MLLMQYFCLHGILPFSKSYPELKAPKPTAKCRGRKSFDTWYYIVTCATFCVSFYQNLKQWKETHNSFKKWPCNLWWISNKVIHRTWKYYKSCFFKSFLHLSYKNAQLLFFVTVLFNISHKKNINLWFLGITPKYELPFSLMFFQNIFWNQKHMINQFKQRRNCFVTWY